PAILNDDANASRQRGPRWAPSYLSELLSIAPPFKCGFTSPSTEAGKNIDSDIASLVKKGLSPKIQRALDIVRVVGNESVHPGELDVRDDVETATKLLALINLVAEQMITHPREIDSLYEKLPPGKREAIERRDMLKPAK
ncbi:DUF4145 domain-containing protein, partial [Burkholderia sp. ABCPW 14]|uniref:DUF4145 domain-containing protein n=1 Tax=Burkholderia sp. ABCPW 14 TaxID=1637860 RepID=UPI0012E33F05